MKTRFAVCSAVVSLFVSVFCSAELHAATPAPPAGACIYALDSTAHRAMQIAGAQSVYTGCGVVVESSASDAFEMEGAETLYLQNHAQVSVVGGAQLNGQTYLYDTITGANVQAVPTTNPGDPLAALSAPASGSIIAKSHTYYDMNAKPTNNTLQPGVYCGGLTIGNTNGTAFTFNPGVYIMAGGGITLNSQAVVKGSGITIYNTTSAGWGCASSSSYTPITISGQVSANLSAPVSGSYAGILFFGNRSACATKGSCVNQVNGGSTAILNGALYFAGDEIQITGANTSGYTMLVADKIYINGNSTFETNSNPIDGITVAVSPAAVSLAASQQQQFSATVTNTANNAVTWNIAPSSVGTISASGLYTAPSVVASQQTVTVTATSQVDTSKYGSATITLAPPIVKTTPTILWNAPAAIPYGTALSSAQLNATANVAGTFAYAPVAGTVLDAGSQTLSVLFTPTDTIHYSAATASVTLVVNKAVPVLSWSAPSAIPYGTALGNTQLNATASVAGTFTYTPAAGAILKAGSQTLSVSFTPTNTTDYATVTANVTLTVNPVTPTVTAWPTASNITYGQTLASSTLSGGTASVAGSFAWTTPTTAPGAGAQSASVIFTPTDTTDYATVTGTASVTVAQAVPSITWATPASIASGTALSSTQLNATASVPGTFAYSPAAGAVLSVGSQNLSVTFTPTDTTEYTTATASVTLTVNPAAQCATNGYIYTRTVVIDHSKVSNSDQTNFPLLLSTTDPLLATVANGGHVQNPNGYDIIFTSDSAGQSPLNFEVESYNPVTGQLVAWVSIPVLSHSSDTVVYLQYGNSAITSSQQNAANVWSNGYAGVWHFGDASTLSTQDSTSNGVIGTNHNALPAQGMIGGGVSLDGSTSFIDLGNPAAFPSGKAPRTMCAWAKLSEIPGWYSWPASYGTPSNSEAMFIGANGNTLIAGGFANDVDIQNFWQAGVWTFVCNVYDGTTAYVYGNGTLHGSAVISWNLVPENAYIGKQVNGSEYWPGMVDEVTISSVARSADWIATEYNNQYDPSTFYSLVPENYSGLLPTDAVLYAGQSRQFHLMNACGIDPLPVSWSIPTGSSGTMDSTGTYSAPAAITSKLDVMVSASRQVDGSSAGSATVTLMPPMSVSVSPASANVYASAAQQQFTATVSNAVNTAVTWSINPSGFGTIDANGLFTAAAMWVGERPQDLTITATSVANPTISSSAVIHSTPLNINGWNFIYSGYGEQMTSTVPVVWSLDAGTSASITADGVLSAPTDISSTQSVTVWAQDLENSAMQESFFIRIGPSAWSTSISPSTVTLSEGESVSLNASMPIDAITIGSGSSLNWTVAPSGVGTVVAGKYTAPGNVNTAQSVVVTASAPANPAIRIQSTITLISPVVSVAPQQTSLTGGQSVQIHGTTNNAINHAVVWSISPQGVGTFDGAGTYHAPTVISQPQTITVTATSVENPAFFSSAQILLEPSPCAAKDYSYMRAIVIDHNRVSNTDQTNFPVLVNVTDAALASVANGGHMQSANGNDIVFSSAPNGFNTLDFEVEQYNAATGQLVAWLRIPTLSHSADTVVYLFYGNSSISSSQQNPGGVWSDGYQAVYHMNTLGAITVPDASEHGHDALYQAIRTSPGIIADAATFDGATSYIQLPDGEFPSYPVANQSTTSFHASVGVWFKTTANGVILSQNTQMSGTAPGLYSPSGSVSALYVDQNGKLRGSLFYLPSPAQILTSSQSYQDGQWHQAVLTYDTNEIVSGPGFLWNLNFSEEGTETMYVDGLPVATQSNTTESGYDSAYEYSIGTGYSATGLPWGWDYYSGSLSQMEIASVTRSADWIQTEFNNQSSPVTFAKLLPEDSGIASLAPTATTLHASAQQQFTAILPGTCGSNAVAWSMLADGAGSLSPTGLYTAPSQIDTPQSVQIQAATFGQNSQTLTATISLLPPVSITTAPGSVTLSAGQTQQFAASVANDANTAVQWIITPSGAGSISATGLYTAPSSIASAQTVTITAVSAADSTQTASATVTLLPTAVASGPTPATCSTNGYAVSRMLVIDHAKVASHDHENFPVLISIADADLASTTNGGHVNSASGYDVFFSLDQYGQSKLDAEVTQYNSATGQLTAWVRIPRLSHSADTVLYLIYGNANVAGPQQNTAGVWDSSYLAVYHLANTSTSAVADSTAYQNNATETNVSSEQGVVGPAGVFNGASSYLTLQGNVFPNFPTGEYSDLGLPTSATSTTYTSTFSLWFKAQSNTGGILEQVQEWGCDDWIFGYCLHQIAVTPGYDDAPGQTMLGVDTYGDIYAFNGEDVVTPNSFADQQWHYAVITAETSGMNTLYVDGKLIGQENIIPTGYSDGYLYFVGTQYTGPIGSNDDVWSYFNGDLSEVRVSDIARDRSWIQTEYNNQSSPSTFSHLYVAGTVTIAPAVANLYANQAQQFQVSGFCPNDLTWTLNSGAPGQVSGGGIYSAPASIASQQTVNVTVSSITLGTSVASAQINLLPVPAPLVVAAAVASPYTVGTSQTFTTTLTDASGSAVANTLVTFAISGANAQFLYATSDANGMATISYAGSSTGVDTLQATASVDGMVESSNSISVSWNLPITVYSAGITLNSLPEPGEGALMGAFTDKNGALIEPLAIGASTRALIVPAGATQLQLGVNDNFYEDNTGNGYVVAVNGVPVTVPATAMPWSWTTGALNSAYQYSVNDGTAPIIAATGLNPGDVVAVAYQSGTVSTSQALVNALGADGNPNFLTGSDLKMGTYYPTHFTSPASYPLNQLATFNAVVKDANNNPVPGVNVTLTVTGANPAQYQATTGSNGIAVFSYTGVYTGNDTLNATADPSGGASMNSLPATLTWVTPLTPGSLGSLKMLSEGGENAAQIFLLTAANASMSAPANLTDIGVYVTGADSVRYELQTDANGNAGFIYGHVNQGPYHLLAATTIDGNVVLSNSISGNWTGSTTPSTATYATLTVGVSGPTRLFLPNTANYVGVATSTTSITPTVAWSMVSGPGTVTFSAPNQPNTTATFSEPGNYVLQMSATDTMNTGAQNLDVMVLAAGYSGTSSGWIGTPGTNTELTGIVPVTVAAGVTLRSGTLSYFPADHPENPIVLNANTTGSGQIGTLDTTQLKNGSYWITLQATDSTGETQFNIAQVTVAGNYKPGRVTTSITDLIVPASGLPIQIERNYDSLNAGVSSDFGYGWSLGLDVDLQVSPNYDVTFTLAGQRRTFHFTPETPGQIYWNSLSPDQQKQMLLLESMGGGMMSNFWQMYLPVYTPDAGLHGTLSDGSTGCFLDWLSPSGSGWECAGGGSYYSPTQYVYTDPNGTAYTISSSGQLQSVVDRNGNKLTVSANGFTSSTGLNVPFVRDAQNRITQITDPQGNVYAYAYDASGNLASVTYPGGTQPSTYTYDANHDYVSGTDFRSNPLPTVAYYDQNDSDPNGISLDGRMKSVTDATGATTSYAYDLVKLSTSITYPADASGAQGTATMVYNAFGDLLNATDPLGHTTTNVYDSKRNLLSATDALGHTTSYTFDNNGNKTSTMYPATAASTNTTSSTAFNQYSEPTSTVDENGNTRAFHYDDNYNPQSVTDGLGTLMSTLFQDDGTMQAGAIGYDIVASPSHVSQFTYDAAGNLATKTDALGRVTSYTYDALGHKLTMIEPIPAGGSAADATTTYTYDAFGNLLSTAAPLARTSSSTYDANNNKLTDTDARGNVTRYQYDSLNRLVLTTYADGTTARRTYDFRGNVLDETDAGGHVTHHAYDLAGRLVSLTRAFGTASASATTYTLDAAGRKTAETDALGHITTYTYDAAGNLLSTSGVAGSFTYAYDNARNRVSMTDGNGHTTQYQYDARKRLTQTTYPDSTTVANTYDGPGNLASVTDQNGHVVQYTYDAANQLSSVVQASSPNSDANTTIYGYDANGHPITLEDANQHTTRNAFDPLGQLTSKTLPDGQLTETRQYDANGNLASLTHFNGAVTTYNYDALNRLLSRSTPGEAVVSHTYTATGQYATTTDASGLTTYAYDSLDRIVTKATPMGALSYTYDAAGHVASIASSNAGGASMSYTYDALNRLATVVDNRLSLGSNTTTYTYDEANNVATVTYPNGVVSQLAYDAVNRLSSLASAPSSYTYQRNPNGNLASASESNGRQVSWSYDGINRLTNETISLDPARNNGTVSYGLDPVGNRLSADSSISALSSGAFSFNSDDQLTSESYDQNGNVIAAAGKTFAYDSQNQLVSMNGGAVSLVYDAFGNRVAKTASGVTTQYLVEDDKNPTGYPQVFDELTNGVVTRTYTYGMQRISESQTIDNVWTTSFYGYDGGGNVRNLTDTTGAVTDTYEYDAFGNLLNSTGSTPNVYLYRGEQYDPDLGLYYLRARYYSPVTGRFMSRDPEDGDYSNPSTLHKYLYANGDPSNHIDPTGHEALVATAELDFWGAVKNAAAVMAVGAATACLLNKSAQTIGGIAANLGNKMFFESTGLCTEKVTSCKTLYPNLIPIEEVPGWYEFESQGEAASALGEEVGGPVVPTKSRPATNGPCAVGGEYDPGWHIRYMPASGGGAQAGSVVGCPVCDDTGGYPVPSQRWGVLVR